MLKKGEYKTRNIDNSPLVNQYLGIGDASFIVHHDVAYCNFNGLYSLSISGNINQDSTKISWTKIPNVPFLPRAGQTMISTSMGIAFYGGRDSEGIIFDDLWIFDGKGWNYIVTKVPPLAYHASCTDKKGRILFYGGTTEDNRQSDNVLYAVDMCTSETQIIPIKTQLRLRYHSITLNQFGECIILGGCHQDGSYNRDMYKLDTTDGTLTKIDTSFSLTMFGQTVSNHIRHIFAAGGGEETSKSCWAFNLDHKCWYRLQTPPPSFVFMSAQMSQNKCLHVLSTDAAKIYTFSIFESAPEEDILTDPSYIEFVRAHIEASIPYFVDEVTATENEITKANDSVRALRKKAAQSSPRGEAIERLREDIERTRRLIRRLDMVAPVVDRLKEKYQGPPQPPVSNSKRTTFADLSAFVSKRKSEREKWKTESEQKRNELDNYAFTLSLQRKSSNLEDVDRHITEIRNLSQLVSSYRKQCAEMAEASVSAEAAWSQRLLTEAAFCEQLSVASKRKSEAEKVTMQNITKCLSFAQKIADRRIEVLEGIDNNKSTEDSRNDTATSMEAQVKLDRINMLRKDHVSIKSQLAATIESLKFSSTSNIQYVAEKINTIAGDFSQWVTEAAEATEIKAPIIIGGNEKVRIVPPSYRSVIRNITDWGALDSEMKIILRNLDK